MHTHRYLYTPILFCARAVRATVTLTTFLRTSVPSLLPYPFTPHLISPVSNATFEGIGGSGQGKGHVPLVTSRGVHCDAMHQPRRSSLRDLGPCAGIRQRRIVSRMRVVIIEFPWDYVLIHTLPTSDFFKTLI